MSNVVTAYISSTGTQSYTLPINAAARYARLWFANTGSTWKAVAEMRVFGAPTPPQSVSKYYFLGKQRVAMRQNGKLTYLHGDQLGSASLATDAAGVTLSQQRYLPYGGLRWTQSGSVFPTDWQYTDQQRQSTHLTGIRMVEYYDYRARMYDPKVGRFISPDSVVPDEKNPQSLNRYAYVYNSPLRFTDPSGHDPLDDNWRQWFEHNYGRRATADDEMIRLYGIAYANEFNWGDFYEWSYNSNDNRWVANIRSNAFDKFGENASSNRSWSAFPDALDRLSAYYTDNEQDQYIRDIGSLWGGLALRSEQSSAMIAAANGMNGQPHRSVFLNAGGLSAEFNDGDADGNIHHWAASLVAGWAVGYIASFANAGREGIGAIGGNPGSHWEDIRITNAAVQISREFMNLGWNPQSPRSFSGIVTRVMGLRR